MDRGRAKDYAPAMVTFVVADVKPERSRLPAVGAARCVASLGWRQPEAMQLGARALVASRGQTVNPLVYAVHLAFAEHRPLVITPDAVWLCLAQSLATHIQLDSEALRRRLVRHDGKLRLSVRRDDFIPGGRNNDWPHVVDQLVAQIREHLGGRADAFVAEFSTTTPTDRIASQIALMDAMRNYFELQLMTLCGIPEITLAGAPEDWASMRRRIDAFRELDLGWWADALDPVLANIEATARGQIDRTFWCDLYKVDEESGGPYATGWINALFAYVGNPMERNRCITGDRDNFHGNQLSNFPSGRSRAPFVWQVMDGEHAMELAGGLWGVTQDADGALGVASGWVVSPARSGGAVITSSDFMVGRNRPGDPVVMILSNRALATLESLRREPGDEEVSLSAQRCKLRSLEGIQHLRRLVGLDLEHLEQLETIAPIAGMTSLKWLQLGNCPRLANLGPVLAQLPQLEELELTALPRVQLADVVPLAGAKHLKHVAFKSCPAVTKHLHELYLTPGECDALRAELTRLA